MLYFLVGFMGSGKTTVGRLLAGELGVPFIDSDTIIEKKTGVSVSELFAAYGENHFRKLEAEFIAELEAENAVISCGGGLPCYNSLIEILLLKGKVIYLKASSETLFERLKDESSQRPLLSGENLRETIITKLSDREQFYNKANVSIQTDELSPEEITAVILSETE